MRHVKGEFQKREINEEFVETVIVMSEFDENQLCVGNRVRIARKNMRMTQQQLADKIHVTKAAISSYEIGRTIPDASILRDLSDALEVSADWLTGRTQIENESFVNSILHDIVLIITKYTKEEQQILLKGMQLLSNKKDR
ncbi:MAG: helix-turn-helix transcriptional regulator [Lachnospiraceae bacterium]|nr:helix-turn-helix transcriptional regulator [Lachnospiraceae bacterium]